MTHRSRPLIAATFAGVVFLGLATFGVLAYTRTSDAKTVVPMYADYRTYESLVAITDNAPLIVVGTVSEIAPATRVIPTSVEVNQLPPHKAADAGYLTTDVTVKVEQVLAGTMTLRGTDIVVIHMGGETAKQKSVMDGAPISQQGWQYVLFLRPTADGRYIIVDGSQGRYMVQDGKLAVLDSGAKQLPVAKQLDGLDVQTVADKIQGAKGGKP